MEPPASSLASPETRHQWRRRPLERAFKPGSLSNGVHWPPFPVGPSKNFSQLLTRWLHFFSQPIRAVKYLMIKPLVPIYLCFSVLQKLHFFFIFHLVFLVVFFLVVFFQLVIVQYRLVNMYFLDIYKTRTLGAPQFCRSCLKRRYALFNYAKILWWLS